MGGMTAAQALNHEWIDTFGKEHFVVPDQLRPKEKKYSSRRGVETGDSNILVSLESVDLECALSSVVERH